MITLYDYLDSGNGYKVRLLLALLDLPFRFVECDIMRGETRTEDFLKINPNGKIPAMRIDDGVCIAESGAMLQYLANGTDYWPSGRLEQADVLQWMFFEQYSHEPAVAVVRFWKKHLDMTPELEAQLPAKMAAGYAALGVMESRLANHDWLAAGRYTIADIALYAYTHVADEGGFDLSHYPAIRQWLARVAARPGHVPITWKPE